MNMSGLLPYDGTPRTVTNPPSTRTYQPATSHMEMHIPMFSTPLATSVPFQPGAFAFDSLSVNPYNMQQPFPVSYPQAIAQTAHYAATSDLQANPTVREARNGFAIERSPPVKSESCSPVPQSHMYNDGMYTEDHRRSNSEPGESGRVNFSTDVDTLMRTIQAKQPPMPQRSEPVKVCVVANHLRTGLTRLQPDDAKSPSKTKKRYQCSMPGCHKSFYQKTHLEIHTRAHTGVKPFVSS